jgi:uncharacterized membrane protein
MADIKQTALIGTVIMIVGVILVVAVNITLLRGHPVLMVADILGIVMAIAGFFVSKS